MKNIWTYEKCLEESKKYKSKIEFSKNNKTAYNASTRNGWIKDFTWLKKPLKDKKWTYETVLNEAKKYGSLNEFRKCNKTAYNLSCKEGWINEYDFLKRRTDEPSYEECLNEAKKYNSRHIFALKARKFYDISIINGWLDDFKWLTPKICDYINGKEDFIYAYFFNDINSVYIGRTIDINRRDYEHRTKENDSVFKFSKENNIDIPQIVIIENNLTLKEGQEREKFWISFYKENGKNLINKANGGSLGGLYGVVYNKQKCFLLAKKCDSKSVFMKKYPTAYVKSLKKGWIKDYVWFKRPKNYNLKWTYDITIEEAKKYNNSIDFKKNNKSAYDAAIRNNWLKDYKWMRMKNTKIDNLIIEFYKNNIDFPLSGTDIYTISNKRNIKKILKCIQELIDKKTNIIINESDKNKIFISNFINFCMLENIDYRQILNIEVIQCDNVIKIIVNNGINDNVKILKI